MFQFNQEHTIYILDKIFYFALLGVGSYFIYQGSVIDRFLNQRTNLATYTEPLNELPTFTVWVMNIPPNFTLEEDMALYFGADFNSMSQLTYGQNNIDGSSQIVEFELVAKSIEDQALIFKIKPTYKAPHITTDFVTKFTFSNI